MADHRGRGIDHPVVHRRARDQLADAGRSKVQNEFTWKSAAERQEVDATNLPALAYNLGTDFAVDRLVLLGANAAPILDFVPPRFPLKGGQIVARGVAAGPEVARLMQTVEKRWVDESFPDVARIEAILDEELRKTTL